MVNMNPGPGGKLFNQKDAEWQKWRDDRRELFDKLVEAELGDDIRDLNERMNQIALKIDEEFLEPSKA